MNSKFCKIYDSTGYFKKDSFIAIEKEDNKQEIKTGFFGDRVEPTYPTGKVEIILTNGAIYHNDLNNEQVKNYYDYYLKELNLDEDKK